MAATATEVRNQMSSQRVPSTPASSGTYSGEALDAAAGHGAVFRHDVFNLAALAAVNTLNFWYLLYGKDFSAFWSATMLYFIVDFAWILLEPRCVKSPAVLLTHHVVAASYMFLPFFYPFTAPKMSYVMTVEVNTWLLIARRVMPSALIEALFYATWFMIRVFFFPYLVWDVAAEYHRVAVAEGTWFHPIAAAPVIQVGLCVLNAQWTYELVSKLFWPKKKAKSHQL